MNWRLALWLVLLIATTAFSIAGIPEMIENYRTFDVGP